MNIPKNFFRKIFWASRMGHSTYLMFFLAFGNFILITYSYLLEGNPFFEKYISDLWMFSIVFVILYIPLSILIGRWHTNTQISVEMTIRGLNNPIQAKMMRILLDVKTGKATEDDIEEFRTFVGEIEKRDINEF